MKKTDNQVIDLNALFAEQAQFAKAEADAQRALEAARASRIESNEKLVKQVTTLIKRGATTGDPLKDEILQVLGLHKDLIEKVSLFSGRLVALPGAELLIIFSGRQRTMFGGPETDEHYVPTERAYLGVLSGERIKIRQVEGKYPHPQIILPFLRYVEMEGVRLGRQKPKRVEGELVLSGSGFALDMDVSAMALLQAIEKFPASGVDQAGAITIGTAPKGEISSEAIADLGMLDEDFKSFRDALYALTPAEMAAGQNI